MKNSNAWNATSPVKLAIIGSRIIPRIALAVTATRRWVKCASGEPVKIAEIDTKEVNRTNARKRRINNGGITAL
jgi:hypothetical protein